MYLVYRLRSFITLLCLGFLLSSLAGCGGGQGAFTPEQPTTTLLPLNNFENTKWMLTSLNGSAPQSGSIVTLAIYPDNFMQGLAGCNHYGVDYLQEADRIQFGDIQQTNQTCDGEGIMAQEASYFEGLASATAYRVSEEVLEFADDQGQTRLVFSRVYPPTTGSLLPGTRWELVSLEGMPPLPGTKLNIEFEQHTLSGFSGCNYYGSGSEYESYAASDDGEFHLLGMILTQMLCEDQVMTQEQAYLDALQRSNSYQVTADQLELRDAEGTLQLVFARSAVCTQPLPNLVGSTWQLVSVEGAHPGAQATQLTFLDEHWYVERSHCVFYISTYQTGGEEIQTDFTSWLGQTCPEASDMRGDFIEAPNRLCLVGDELHITTRHGLVYAYQPVPQGAQLPLEGATWKLLSIVGLRQVAGEPLPLPDPFPVQDGTEITLTLAGGKAFGSAGCNDYQAAYTSGPELSVGAVGATKKACPLPEGVMQQEQRYLSAFAAVNGYRLLGEQLWLQTTGGEYLVFTR